MVLCCPPSEPTAVTAGEHREGMMIGPGPVEAPLSQQSQWVVYRNRLGFMRDMPQNYPMHVEAEEGMNALQNRPLGWQEWGKLRLQLHLRFINTLAHANLGGMPVSSGRERERLLPSSKAVFECRALSFQMIGSSGKC